MLLFTILDALVRFFVFFIVIFSFNCFVFYLPIRYNNRVYHGGDKDTVNNSNQDLKEPDNATNENVSINDHTVKTPENSQQEVSQSLSDPQNQINYNVPIKKQKSIKTTGQGKTSTSSFTKILIFSLILSGIVFSIDFFVFSTKPLDTIIKEKYCKQENLENVKELDSDRDHIYNNEIEQDYEGNNENILQNYYIKKNL